jgi:hypothetical protein
MNIEEILETHEEFGKLRQIWKEGLAIGKTVYELMNLAHYLGDNAGDIALEFTTRYNVFRKTYPAKCERWWIIKTIRQIDTYYTNRIYHELNVEPVKSDSEDAEGSEGE